jgi:hypothetical protein
MLYKAGQTNHNSVVMTVLRRGIRDLSLRFTTLSFTSQGEMSSSSALVGLLLLMMLFPLLVVKWLLGSLLIVLFLTTELDLAREEAVTFFEEVIHGILNIYKKNTKTVANMMC